VLDQNLAGHAQQVIGMMSHIGHNYPRLTAAVVDPVLAGRVTLTALVVLAEGQRDAHRRLLR